MIPMLKEKYYLPSELIYRKGEPDLVSTEHDGKIEKPDVALYLIKRG